MSRPRFTIAGLLLAALVRLGAAEEAPPLEAAKRELRELQNSQKNQSGAAATDGLKIATPALTTPSDQAASPGRWLTERKAEERMRQQEGTKNWLVDGVEKLDRRPAAGKRDASGEAHTAKSMEDAETTNASGAPSLLALYDAQQRTGKGETTRKSPGAAAADPFAPFLKEWLGSSPVREPLMKSVLRAAVMAETGSASGLDDFKTVAGGGGDINPRSTGASGNAQPNPYLADLNPATTGNPRPATIPAPEASGSTAATLPSIAPLPTFVSPPPASLKSRTAPKGPPPSPADEKKYFPQLHKF